jgi:hypothetical protein
MFVLPSITRCTSYSREYMRIQNTGSQFTFFFTIYKKGLVCCCFCSKSFQTMIFIIRGFSTDKLSNPVFFYKNPRLASEVKASRCSKSFCYSITVLLKKKQVVDFQCARAFCSSPVSSHTLEHRYELVQKYLQIRYRLMCLQFKQSGDCPNNKNY